jgi:CubicO group peptidase (beta-lactamase class C family)
MSLVRTLSIILMMVITSCSPFKARELAKLPMTRNPNSLDSLQAQSVYERAQYFPNGTQLSICIIKEDSEKYVGIERRNDSLVYVENSDSVFEIGSITKTFTGTMLAKLVYDKKVHPNDPIKNYLPITLNQSALHGKEITLAQLAEHTSGLPFEPINVKNDDKYPFDPYAPYKSALPPNYVPMIS